ncbi:hypothetical protein [Rhodoferax sp.]|uniref:hypothetical protein n=1 Tax=Rhodoferax sp. TaxID=50421 RepID=UPI00374DDCE5
MEALIETLYTVALADYPGLPDKERVAAEVRYCKALERRIGPPEDVVHTLKAVERLADDGDVSEPTDEVRRLVHQWNLACNAARTAAMQGLGDLPEAWFDVRVS